MQEYIVNDYVTVQIDLPVEFHANIYQQTRAIFESKSNEWNDIYPLIPELAEVLAHSVVDGALTSILMVLAKELILIVQDENNWCYTITNWVVYHKLCKSYLVSQRESKFTHNLGYHR